MYLSVCSQFSDVLSIFGSIIHSDSAVMQTLKATSWAEEDLGARFAPDKAAIKLDAIGDRRCGLS
jgi:hypothetical protein